PGKGPVVRIGINTGQVSLGRVGSDAGLTVIGDAVNVASRLKEAAAEGGIYISYDTHRLVRNLFRVEPLGEVSVKGRQMPLNVYRVIGSQPRLFFPGNEGVEGVDVPMIGREREMAMLRQTLEETAQTGRGGVIPAAG
nr:adenylate/guanylate cyclase domain-containing protein [Promineifilum sp.]